jgi:surface polysaccharide O-acyltransferase-like enzyme
VAKLITLMVNVSVYSIAILIFNNVLGLTEVDSHLTLRSLMPTIYSAYWFFTTYILLYLATPFITALLGSLDQHQHGRLCLTLFVVFSVIPTLFDVTFGFSELMWFVTLFIIAAYVRKYLTEPFSRKAKRWVIGVWALSVVSLVGSVLFFDLLALSSPEAIEHATILSNLNKLPTVLIAITGFLWVVKAKPRHNALVNSLAASVFGIYLFHDHPIMRVILWQVMFQNANYQTSPYLAAHAAFAVVSVFGVGVAIDTIKRGVLDKPIQRAIEWGLRRIETTVNRLRLNANAHQKSVY